MRKLFTSLLVAFLSFSILFSTPLALDSANILVNGNLKASTDNKVPDGWGTSIWDNNGTVSWTPSKGKQAAYVTISSDADTDARITHQVELKANTKYLFTAEAKAKSFKSQDNAGANISVLGKIEKSRSLYDTKGKWEQLSFHIIAPNEDTTITVSAGIGGHSSLNSGTASFRNLQIVAVDVLDPAVPSVTIDSPSAPNTSSNNKGKGLGLLGWLVIIFVLLIVAGVIYYIFVSKPEDNPDEESKVEIEQEDEDYYKSDSEENNDEIDDDDITDAEDNANENDFTDLL